LANLLEKKAHNLPGWQNFKILVWQILSKLKPNNLEKEIPIPAKKGNPCIDANSFQFGKYWVLLGSGH
jgi:hypothetical protein